ncbi:phospholipase A2 inhibitor NAI-like [Hemicordylus capensis]|uniref:phospholipase A2 inhibitor NAI-like n=1 Tax=Hemicordylus capensis TaxID=884348 RepID=UPI0023046375|nr:phospholipase A2 inhibitor NAI-like [Hemicordylus capensis]
MMKILLGSVVSFVLVTAGSSLECEVCSGLGTSCVGKMQACEAGKDTCIIVLAENTLAGYSLQTINKGCGSSSVCHHGPNYSNFGQGKVLRSSTTCCVGDACRTAHPQLPPAVTRPNGKQCPACYAVSPSTCNDNETVDCAGPEDNCLDLALTITYGTFLVQTAQKGCASESACRELRRGESNTADVHIDVTKAECTVASLPRPG